MGPEIPGFPLEALRYRMRKFVNAYLHIYVRVCVCTWTRMQGQGLGVKLSSGSDEYTRVA